MGLCDTVHVYISKLGIEVSCKVTETEYDVLLERYSSITLSNASVYSRNSSLSRVRLALPGWRRRTATKRWGVWRAR